MIKEYSLRLLPQQAATDDSIRDYISKTESVAVDSLRHVRVLRRSIDARQRTVYVNLKVRAYIDEEPTDELFTHIDYPDVSHSPHSAIVVGAGPAGLFAALRLIELGVRPIVLERGKDVRERKKDLALISRLQAVDPESNYCFGEGGAGAYSDGKLFTRSKKRGDVQQILNIFCQHGASTNILSDVHPHIGTDRLPRVIENIRTTILSCGGEVHFQTKMTSLISNGVRAIHLLSGREEEFHGPVILATGHSARDVYRSLYHSHLHLEAKGIAVGVRLEHPSKLIDQIQYHNREGRGRFLPAAEYSFVTQVENRGVYSFCMCPGGIVIPAATDDQQIVVNGMSPSARNTAWSNSGIVVELHPEDIIASELMSSKDFENGIKEFDADFHHAGGAMLHYQECLERLCWLQGNRRQIAPAQRMCDFVDGRLSNSLPSSSYAPGLVPSPLHFWLPVEVRNRLQQALLAFGRSRRGFLTNEAVLIAVETRTSSPIRIVRDPQSLHHIQREGLFPCGEGAGYAGGIVSAAIDGQRCAEACAQYLMS